MVILALLTMQVPNRVLPGKTTVDSRIEPFIGSIPVKGTFIFKSAYGALKSKLFKVISVLTLISDTVDSKNITKIGREHV